MKDKTGQLRTSVEDQLTRWKEHFQNKPSTATDQSQLEPGTLLNIHTGGSPILKALKRLKNGKAVGGDEMVNQLLNLAWTTKETPANWQKRLLIPTS